MASTLATAAEVLGRPQQNAIPVPPLQLRGYGANVAAYFDDVEFEDKPNIFVNLHERENGFVEGRRQLMEYLRDVFSCLIGEGNNDDGFSVTGNAKKVHLYD